MIFPKAAIHLNLALAALCLAAAGCSTRPIAPSSNTGTATTGTANAPAPTASSNSRSGGYYKDDGPGVSPPDVALIPDAVPRFEPVHSRANRPYVVFGQTYQPMTVLAPFKQRGMASWYGRKFHGQKTSVGETYDMYGMTAAHPTLPLPSYVRVTNVRTGKSVVVRVNDRGPFLNQRVIDLSYTAAAKLGYVNAGSTEVEVELVTRFDEMPVLANALPTPTSPTPTSPIPTAVSAATVPAVAVVSVAPERLSIETIVSAPDVIVPPLASASLPSTSPPSASLPSISRPVFLQLGAFSSQDSADVAKDRMTRQLDDLKIDGVKDPVRVVRDAGLFKIHLGPFASAEAAAANAERIRQQTQFKPFAVQRPAS